MTFDIGAIKMTKDRGFQEGQRERSQKAGVLKRERVRVRERERESCREREREAS